MKKHSRFLVANIAWNISGWRNIYVNPKAGHRYVKGNPGHECLNFEFNKKGLDTEDHIHGYAPWTHGLPTLDNDAVIFFYTKNTKQKNLIVGLFGNAKVLEPAIMIADSRFGDGFLRANIQADKILTMLFPVSLNADIYRNGTRRLVPQINFTYVDSSLARRIILDEMTELASGARREEYEKLVSIYEYISHEKFKEEIIFPSLGKDEQQQDELENIEEINTQTKDGIVRELESLGPQTQELVTYHGRRYKRDNKTVVQLKKLRDFKCQICGFTIEKRDGRLYVEAAHINMKSHKGPERPNNIIILCPNHHKEFDFGAKKVIEHTTEKIIFELNNRKYEISLALQP